MYAIGLSNGQANWMYIIGHSNGQTNSFCIIGLSNGQIHWLCIIEHQMVRFTGCALLNIKWSDL